MRVVVDVLASLSAPIRQACQISAIPANKVDVLATIYNTSEGDVLSIRTERCSQAVPVKRRQSGYLSKLQSIFLFAKR